jgi:hypothetical protein
LYLSEISGAIYKSVNGSSGIDWLEFDRF